MSVRDARVDDAAEIVALVNPVIALTTVTFTSSLRDENSMRATIAARPGAFLVAEYEGRVAGFATYFQFRVGNGYASTMEHTINVGPGARRMGFGRLLMAELEGRARQNGVGSLIAAISGENPEAMRFHAAIGFVEAGRLQAAGRKFDRWIDLVLMQKMLVTCA
ncbi:GNAT family N-acetyltransferase [Roseivivax isoporae]|uniref:GNAT family acetyltransferase n=1 Tax=Roseivivax isoporae LMG 25204 TaxID=1449351 RepID=X7FD65_9RHOB|nr:GNAT family N-acetyltransferase [Roseivivax isoporae]ETX30755.1 GNAT family acetyltransferase [Roseivivax isoporae LMG 25204]